MSDLFSVILLSYQSEARLKDTSEKIILRLQKEKIPFELIIMDDGSKDQSYEIARSLENEYSEVRAYQLSRNFNSPYSTFAGLKLSKGACAATMQDDLQRPLDVMVAMYREWQDGAKLVIPYRSNRNDGLLSDMFSRFYYRIMNDYSNVDFPPGGADGFLADREVIDILNEQISPRNTTPLMEVFHLGFNPVYIPFDRPKTANKSRWTWKKKVKLASDTFFGNSNFPLRFITGLGFITSVISFLSVVFIIVSKLFFKSQLFGFPVQGWATLVILVTFFNGLVLFCLGIVSNYIWRIFEEVKGRPGFIIKKKEH